MAKTLGIDYGEKRIGYAVSDPTGMLATPHSVLEYKGLENAVKHTVELAGELGVEQIVVGLPLSLSGGEGPSAQAARAFSSQVQEACSLPMDHWDERFTSKTAEQALIEGGTRRKKRKGLVDKLAAQIMLQTYLDAHWTDL